jgi:hypothetical protein
MPKGPEAPIGQNIDATEAQPITTDEELVTLRDRANDLVERAISTQYKLSYDELPDDQVQALVTELNNIITDANEFLAKRVSVTLNQVAAADMAAHYAYNAIRWAQNALTEIEKAQLNK